MAWCFKLCLNCPQAEQPQPDVDLMKFVLKIPMDRDVGMDYLRMHVDQLPDGLRGQLGDHAEDLLQRPDSQMEAKAAAARMKAALDGEVQTDDREQLPAQEMPYPDRRLQNGVGIMPRTNDTLQTDRELQPGETILIEDLLKVQGAPLSDQDTLRFEFESLEPGPESESDPESDSEPEECEDGCQRS